MWCACGTQRETPEVNPSEAKRKESNDSTLTYLKINAALLSPPSTVKLTAATTTAVEAQLLVPTTLLHAQRSIEPRSGRRHYSRRVSTGAERIRFM